MVVRETVGRRIAAVYAPRIAPGLAPFMNLQLRAVETKTADLEQRIVEQKSC